MLRRIARLVLAGLALSVGGCFVQPYDGQVTNGATTPFTASGYTDVPNANVVVEMLPYGGAWTTVATARSGSTPVYGAGAWSSNSPALYWFSTTVTGPIWYDGKLGQLRMRNTTSGTNLYGGPVDAASCFLNTITRTGDFYGVAYGCGFNRTQIWVDNGNVR